MGRAGMKGRANSEDNNFSTVDASGNADDDSVKVNSDRSAAAGGTGSVTPANQPTTPSGPCPRRKFPVELAIGVVLFIGFLMTHGQWWEFAGSLVLVARGARALLVNARPARLADAKTREAAEIEEVLQSPLMQDERIKSFYQTTLDAWSSGKLASLGPGYASEGRTPYEGFLRKYPPKRGSALSVFLEKYPPCDGEFLVGLGNLGNAETTGWFVLTNLRLVQRDGKDNGFKDIVLDGVDTYRKEGAAKAPKTLIFKMKSGEEITFANVLMNPKDNVLTEAISLAQGE
jgi:hypothetical protein